MKRKFLGAFLLLSIVAMFAACGDSSNASDDEDCLLDPDSPNCVVDDGTQPEDTEE